MPDEINEDINFGYQQGPTDFPDPPPASAPPLPPQFPVLGQAGDVHDRLHAIERYLMMLHQEFKNAQTVPGTPGVGKPE